MKYKTQQQQNKTSGLVALTLDPSTWESRREEGGSFHALPHSLGDVLTMHQHLLSNEGWGGWTTGAGRGRMETAHPTLWLARGDREPVKA